MFKYILQVFSIILTISLLFFNIYVAKTLSYAFVTILMGIMLIVSYFLFGYRNVDKRDFRYKLMLVSGLAFLIQSILYLVATKTGYTLNFSSIFKNYIEKRIVVNVFITIILREIIRYICINSNNRTKWQALLLETLVVIMCSFVDLSIATKVYTFGSFDLIYEFIALFLVPSIAKNILLNYISKIGGYVITFAYVLIMDLYIYFMPIKPDINVLLQAVVLLIFPYIVYNYLNQLNKKRTIIKNREKKKENKLVTALSTIVFIILVCLVSREFTYSMIGIGSESMTGTINKGDAIIYKRYEQGDNLRNKVIVFRKNNVMIVHRVVKVYILDGKEVYQTKGDNNESADNWLVEEKDLIGVFEKRIPLIAWPSVILGELF